MRQSTRSSSGFATLLAVWSVLLVGITIACLMRRFSTETKRTAEEADRAQLRQMVIAGSLSKSASAVMLPKELQKSGGELEVHPGVARSVEVSAKIHGRHDRWSGTQMSE